MLSQRSSDRDTQGDGADAASARMRAGHGKRSRTRARGNRLPDVTPDPPTQRAPAHEPSFTDSDDDDFVASPLVRPTAHAQRKQRLRDQDRDRAAVRKAEPEDAPNAHTPPVGSQQGTSPQGATGASNTAVHAVRPVEDALVPPCVSQTRAKYAATTRTNHARGSETPSQQPSTASQSDAAANIVSRHAERAASKCEPAASPGCIQQDTADTDATPDVAECFAQRAGLDPDRSSADDADSTSQACSTPARARTQPDGRHVSRRNYTPLVVDTSDSDAGLGLLWDRRAASQGEKDGEGDDDDDDDAPLLGGMFSRTRRRTQLTRRVQRSSQESSSRSSQAQSPPLTAPTWQTTRRDPTPSGSALASPGHCTGAESNASSDSARVMRGSAGENRRAAYASLDDDATCTPSPHKRRRLLRRCDSSDDGLPSGERPHPQSAPKARRLSGTGVVDLTTSTPPRQRVSPNTRRIVARQPARELGSATKTDCVSQPESPYTEWYQERAIEEFPDSDDESDSVYQRVTTPPIRRHLFASIPSAPALSPTALPTPSKKRARVVCTPPVEEIDDDATPPARKARSDSRVLTPLPVSPVAKTRTTRTTRTTHVRVGKPSAAGTSDTKSSEMSSLAQPSYDVSHELCQPGESVREMLERLGEDTVADKISQAKANGCIIVGGESIGFQESRSQSLRGGDENLLAKFRNSVGRNKAKYSVEIAAARLEGASKRYEERYGRAKKNNRFGRGRYKRTRSRRGRG